MGSYCEKAKVKNIVDQVSREDFGEKHIALVLVLVPALLEFIRSGLFEVHVDCKKGVPDKENNCVTGPIP